jgi:hypothetical protein
MRYALVLAILVLAGCKQEPDFDARYDAAEKHIRAKAGAIDAELAARERQRAQSGKDAPPPASQ